MTPSQIAGFIAADGTFTGSGNRFVVRVALGAIDEPTVLAIRDGVGVGAIHRYPPRQPSHEGEARWQVQSLRELYDVIVPFCDEYLLPSRKREQYVEWRAELMEHLHGSHRTWLHGPRICAEEACDGVVRAKGLCRRHYYVEFGG